MVGNYILLFSRIKVYEWEIPGKPGGWQERFRHRTMEKSPLPPGSGRGGRAERGEFFHGNRKQCDLSALPGHCCHPRLLHPGGGTAEGLREQAGGTLHIYDTGYGYFGFCQYPDDRPVLGGPRGVPVAPRADEADVDRFYARVS